MRKNSTVVPLERSLGTRKIAMSALTLTDAKCHFEQFAALSILQIRNKHWYSRQSTKLRVSATRHDLGSHALTGKIRNRRVYWVTGTRVCSLDQQPAHSFFDGQLGWYFFFFFPRSRV
jgi:hypothetical protein